MVPLLIDGECVLSEIDGDLRLPCHQARLRRWSYQPTTRSDPSSCNGCGTASSTLDDAIVASEHRAPGRAPVRVQRRPQVDALIAGARDHVAERLKMLEQRLEGQ